MPLHTVGHGTLASDTFAELLRSAELVDLVDIRSFPGSRHNPQFSREDMERWMPAAGVDYRWIRALGGRRRPRPDSRHVALRNAWFRAYADHMETDDFSEGVEQLLGGHRLDETAVMCSESVWWRCHRRLLADHLVLVRGLDVVHLMHDGRRTPHAPTEGARLDGNRVAYDVGATSPLALESTTDPECP